MALSVRKHVGQNVDAEVKEILSQCQTEEDKAHTNVVPRSRVELSPAAGSGLI